MNKEVKLLDQNVLAKSENIDSLVAAFHEQNFSGFQLALATAKYMGQLREMIDDEYMKSIMPLAGSRIGFKSDKDKGNDKYPVNVVRDCLIESTLIGLQPIGNQWNIIGGNMYVTKEGGEYLLSKIKGLSSYEVIPDIPEMRNEKSATVKCLLKWEYLGEKKEKTVNFPIKVNAYMSDDAILGKAKRKSYVEIINSIKGTNLVDSDLEDRDVTAPKSKLEITLEKEGRKIEVEEAEALDQSVLDTIEGFTTREEVKAFYYSLSADDKKTYKAIITKKDVSLMTKK
jgi:hypothetical protein